MQWNNLNKDLETIIKELRDKTPYEVLRVIPSASMDDIRIAYKYMVKAYHPDISDIFMRSTNEEIIKIINSAYEFILKERHESR